MIVFDLHCDAGHRFEGWFGSSSDYEEQKASGLVSCPHCGSDVVGKAPMAPAVGAKGNTTPETRMPVPATAAHEDAQPVSNTPITPEVQKALTALAKAQEKALKNSTWVGKDFASQSREMHYGERDEAPIHGQASIEEAKALVDEGVPVAPLPFPVAPPDELN
ncbi:hypothetical protein NAP1_05705 [Erythrobacter sp. NAP1]|uniref:DUF1178 family protein n=1 Tax=Erythrobacter sp. NAP1 TaxID=237727 RepID=UPI0000686D3D|nr:DUF1178 family protein [Erythrobacter sp. NAP1]EAQ30247.1 hypothetical protein NAP1_05705 [Erythrobacter sp. NAP1]